MGVNTIKVQDAILNYLKEIYPDCGVTREIENHVISIKSSLGITSTRDIALSEIDGSLQGLSVKGDIKKLYFVSNSEIVSKPVTAGCQLAWGLKNKRYSLPVHSTGEKPGLGDYKCITCGTKVNLPKYTDILRPCVKCGKTTFNKIYHF